VNETFQDFLKEIQPDADSIQQAARYYVAQRSDDLPEDEMAAEVRRALANPADADAAQRELARDSRALENAALAVLSVAWQDPNEREKVRAAFVGAKGKLPLIELGILATVTIYGMWLVVTGGVKKHRVIIQRKPDGTLVEVEVTEFFGPPPVAKLLKSFYELG
jgi:hypothetical protein